MLRETVAYLDHGATKTTLITDGKKPPPEGGRGLRGGIARREELGKSRIEPAKTLRRKAPPAIRSGGPMPLSWEVEWVSTSKSLGSKDPDREASVIPNVSNEYST